ncbi:MAG: PKD domain-containing protein, partial [Xanthomonadales bacterium]|nr:PKD domain-containing protein [Xanthomonadales bacterium]
MDTSLRFTVDITTYFTIPTTGGGYLYDVDWGDGNQSLAQTGNASHSYGSSGEYQITITGAFPRFYFNNTGTKLQLKSIDQWGDVGYSANQTNAFYGCGHLETIADDVSWFDSIVYGTRMFRGCASLTALPSSSHFASLVNGEEMFRDTYSMVLNDGLNFPLLQNANSLFRLRTTVPVNIPDSLVFGSLTTANQAFYNTLMSVADYSKLLINV